MSTASSAMKIITPSFLSGFVSIVGSVVVVVYVLTPFLYRGSYLERYGEVIRSYPGGLVEIYAQIVREVNSSDMIGNVMVFCVWALLGFALYYLVLSLLTATINLTSFVNLLSFKNSDKKSIVTWAFERLVLRALGLAGLAAFLFVTIQTIVPAILTLISAVFSSNPVIGTFYLLASVVFLSVIVHIIIVLLRVVFLRVRLISWMYDTSDL